MTGIVIAAGRGLRMRPYTHEVPKCLLPVAGRPLLSYTLDSLRLAGCDRIVIVTGHLAHLVDAPGCEKVHNDDFTRNNILHSLMYARLWMDDDVIATYSDIYAEPWIHEALARAPGEIVIAVDRDWQSSYDGRLAHPVSEAEKVFAEVTPIGALVSQIGKHLNTDRAGDQLCGEFLGLWKMDRAGARRFVEAFEALDRRIGPDQPFGAAARWRQAYITDMLGHMIASGVHVQCLLIERGWAELDSVEDYDRLPSLTERQRLASLDFSQ